jgi:hypothetical protein
MQICEGAYANADKTLDTILTEKVKEKVKRAAKKCYSADKSRKSHLKKTLKESKNVKISTVKKNETDEWVNKVYINGKYNENQTYYTNDKQDALDTKKEMIKDFKSKGYTICNESIINEALSEKGIETIKKMLSEKEPRNVAVKLIDILLSKKIGLTSSDLPDTATFANGLDAIEDALNGNDYNAAWTIAKETAMEMLEDEGYSEEF